MDPILYRFNPTLVRLRRFRSNATMTRVNVFQSHAGSIEAWTARASPSSPSGFNPTLVRLRPHSEHPEVVLMAEFQSHAGSIEAPAPCRRTRPIRTRFQSHAGSIEAFLFRSRSGCIDSVSIPRWFD